ncbi:MAG: membrane protein insertase YidC [Planctomycetota bacterium]
MNRSQPILSAPAPIRRLPGLLTAVLALFLWTLPTASAQGGEAPTGEAESGGSPSGETVVPSPGPTEPFWVDFGGGDGRPGFRVQFHPYGAGVIQVKLLDHDARKAEGEEASEGDGLYTIVEREDSAPGQPNSAPLLSMYLQRTGVENAAVPLESSPWTYELLDAEFSPTAQEPPHVSGVRFTLQDGLLTWTKTFLYDSPTEAGSEEDQTPRRDLRIVIGLTTAADAQIPGGATASLRLTSVPLATPRSDYVLGANPARAAVAVDDGSGGVDLVVLAPGEDQEDLDELGSNIAYAGSANRFFGAFLYPIDKAARDALYRTDILDTPSLEQKDTPAGSVPQPRYAMSMPFPAAGQTQELQFRLFLGPKDFDVFNERTEYERFDGVLAEVMAPPFCFCSIPGAKTMGQALTWLLSKLQLIFVNWGLSIVALTCLVRGLLFPINFRMQKSMRAYGAKMAKLKPQLDALQKKYANDKQQLQKKMLEFQREHKIFPPVGGCLPIFLTMPIYIGLFSALRVSYDLRQQPFVGWIDDLSRPDALFETGIDLEWFSAISTFNLLPFIYVALNLYLVSRQPLPNDAQQRQVAVMMRFIPILFGVLLYGYAAGMFVYMITSGLWSLMEQRIVKKVLGPIDPSASGMAPTPMM